MALSEKNKREYSEEEIDILRGVIDYADRMIYEDITLNPLGGFADTGRYVSHSNASLYKQLRRSAYAKTVVIDTELKGRNRLAPLVWLKQRVPLMQMMGRDFLCVAQQ